MDSEIIKHLSNVINKPVTRLALSDSKYLQIGVGEKIIKKRHVRNQNDFYTKYEIFSWARWRIFFNNQIKYDSYSIGTIDEPDFSGFKIEYISSLKINSYGDLDVFCNDNIHIQFIKDRFNSQVAILFVEGGVELDF